SAGPIARGSSGSRVMTWSTISSGTFSASSAPCSADWDSACESASEVPEDRPQKKTAIKTMVAPTAISVGISHRRVEEVLVVTGFTLSWIDKSATAHLADRRECIVDYIR